jgi:hypothetical protein
MGHMFGKYGTVFRLMYRTTIRKAVVGSLTEGTAHGRFG